MESCFLIICISVITVAAIACVQQPSEDRPSRSFYEEDEDDE